MSSVDAEIRSWRGNVTEGSFDTYMWQTLERKAAFIAQVTRGDLPDRDVDDIGDQALSFAEVKALATGDPLVLEKAAVDADVARLSRLERAHQDDQHRLRRAFESATQRAQRAEERLAHLEFALGRVTDTRGDRFAMTVDGCAFDKRAEAGERLQRILGERLDGTPPEMRGPAATVGTLGGLEVTAQPDTTIEDEVHLAIPAAHVEVILSAEDLNRSDPSIMITRLERQLQRLSETIDGLKREASDGWNEADRAGARLRVPWDRTDDLGDLRRRQKEIEESLAASTAAPPTAELQAAESVRLAGGAFATRSSAEAVGEAGPRSGLTSELGL